MISVRDSIGLKIDAVATLAEHPSLFNKEYIKKLESLCIESSNLHREYHRKCIESKTNKIDYIDFFNFLTSHLVDLTKFNKNLEKVLYN